MNSGRGGLQSFADSQDDSEEIIRERMEQKAYEKKMQNEALVLSRQASKSSSATAPNGSSANLAREVDVLEKISSSEEEEAEEGLKALKAKPNSEVLGKMPTSLSFDQVPLEHVLSTVSGRSQPPMASFQRVILTECPEDIGNEESRETSEVCRQIQRCRELRRKYHVPVHQPPYFGPFDPEKYREVQAEAEEDFQRYWGPMFRGHASAIFEASFPDAPSRIVKPILTVPLEELSKYHFETKDGVYCVFHKDTGRLDPELPTPLDFVRDSAELSKFYNSPAAKTVCFKRLQLLEARFHLHTTMNGRRESQEQKKVSHRDFYNVRKVDGHIHHSAIMTQKHLLRFIKHKIKRCADEVVIERNGRYLTLREVFDSLGLTAYDLSIDHLDMHADNTFHRFDRFNLKYNPVGETRLREIFLKTSNLISGRYLAEITQQVFKDLEENKYVLSEPRLSIYGRNPSEWTDLGKWYCTHRLASANIRWMIQIPRLYSAYKSGGQIKNFQELLDNIFVPLFEATLNPHLHPEIDLFLNTVVGFDCVDDESKVDEPYPNGFWPKPAEWNLSTDPPYAYWIYYIYANLRELNTLRAKVGKTTFSLRPHAGEAGDLSHLSDTYLCAESINHGIMLRKSPPLQYLYYLDQIGLAMSPLSNNSLFVAYEANPFPVFFARGMHVALSTDDPLLLHMTKDPLVEEYSVASQVWKLSSTDRCEIARNSVLMSGLEHPFKSHYLGDSYFEPGVAGNNIETTNVPDVRVQYRYETLQAEMRFVEEMASIKF